MTPTSSEAGANADRAALQAELDALMGEILESTEDGASPFDRSGQPPDLVILSSSDVRGEVTPCG